VKYFRSLVPFGFLLALAVVFSTYLVTEALKDIRMSHQIIKVRGYAEVPVRSDLARWRVTVRASSREIAEAYRVLASHRVQALDFVRGIGLGDAVLETGAVSVSELRKRTEKGQLTNEIEGYALSQTLEVKSPDVEAVANAAGKISDLLGRGVELHADSPLYYYTRLDELKSPLLIAATRDARERASTLAEGSGVRLGPLRAARQGIFSLRPADSAGISESGYEDTSSIEKMAAAVVTVDYAMK
jgi:hypothetical protein